MEPVVARNFATIGSIYDFSNFSHNFPDIFVIG